MMMLLPFVGSWPKCFYFPVFDDSVLDQQGAIMLDRGMLPLSQRAGEFVKLFWFLEWSVSRTIVLDLQGKHDGLYMGRKVWTACCVLSV